MGIDIYMKWRKQSKKEADAQCTGCCVEAGRVGYLREAYHGEPYATRHLVREAFDPPYEAEIPAKTLRERLPKTIELAVKRLRVVYKVPGNDAELKKHKDVKSFIDFVELAERKEKETGEPVIINASY
jgi:hypothetical protein